MFYEQTYVKGLKTYLPLRLWLTLSSQKCHLVLNQVPTQFYCEYNFQGEAFKAIGYFYTRGHLKHL